MQRYEQIPHTADLAARIYGRTPEELFENAAFAMFDMAADLSGIEADLAVEIDLEAGDREALLVSWLNELLYRAFAEGSVFNEFKVIFPEDNRLKAEARGLRLFGNTGRMYKEIKAATYHDLEIRKAGRGYEVTVVFDV